MTNTCHTCSPACLTCQGPTVDDCIECNYMNGYGNSNGGQGLCSLVVCSNGMYMDIDYTSKKALCKYCYATCSKCTKYGDDICITCKKGFFPFPSSKAGFLKCLTCSQINSGLYTKEDGAVEVNLYLVIF